MSLINQMVVDFARTSAMSAGVNFGFDVYGTVKSATVSGWNYISSVKWTCKSCGGSLKWTDSNYRCAKCLKYD